MLKLWLLPKVWLQGSQSTTTGGSSATKAEAGGDHRLVRAQHALGVDDGLGLAGGAGGEQEFGDGVGRDLRLRGGDAGLVFGAEQIGEQRGLAVRLADCASPPARHSSGTAAAMARAKARRHWRTPGRA